MIDSVLPADQQLDERAFVNILARTGLTVLLTSSQICC